MMTKQTYKTFDNTDVSLSRIHILDLWEDYLELHPLHMEVAYREVLIDVPVKVMKCFDRKYSHLQIPFIVKTNHYPQYLVASMLEAVDSDGNIMVLVVSKLYRSIGDVCFETEIKQVIEKVNWNDHAEPL